MIDVVDLFLKVAHQHGQRHAIIESAGVTTYDNLLMRVQRLAHAIANIGEPHPRVAILLPQGGWAYSAMFATLMAGGVYTPINLDHPVDRRRQTISQFEPNAVVAMGENDFLDLDLANAIVRITIDRLGCKTLIKSAPAGDLAYVMFTSGSTGAPKGVMISRMGLALYVNWAHKAMDVTPEDRWSQHPNIAFDLSVLDIFGALCAGASLYPLTQTKERLFPAHAIRTHQLTIWNSVPSVVDLMRRTDQLNTNYLASLRLITFCGEPLLSQHLDFLFSARPDIRVHNTYGPTEATVSMTLLRLCASNYRQHCENTAALGEPIAGMNIFLEDGDRPDEGEIVIAGPQVARGYWRDEVLSDKAFGTRIVGSVVQPAYRTGDWAKRKGNDLYFVSRIDRQIKRQGNRIELGDVDAALRLAGASATCTVFVDNYLVAFVEQAESADVTALSRRIRKTLPSYALPNQIRALPVLPRNANDKIDAKALEALVRDAHSQDRAD